jgi:hypothetical protein
LDARDLSARLLRYRDQAIAIRQIERRSSRQLVQNADFSMSILANPMGLIERTPRVALNLWPNLLSFVPVLSTRPLPNGSLPGPLILRRRNALAFGPGHPPLFGTLNVFP